MFDKMVTKLVNMSHVPDLKKNLISLGVLEAKGYNIVQEKGVLKVFCVALVIGKGVGESN